ncbi:MAG: 50S ribosomal subunit protein L25 [Candidatus Westeberhardia cardiocondylae]|nr:50S ribosomal subunit protein L25 [Candidatus Westeberhardia cardiocondylae]
MITIYATKKNKNGTNNSRKLRNKNNLPGIIYGNKNTSIPIKLDEKQYYLITRKKNIFLKKIIKILIDDKLIETKIKEIQYHPCTSKIIHIDFIKIK